MFCWNCGTQVADETRFCPKCGKPQTQGPRADDPIQIQVNEPVWEVCEIVYHDKNEFMAGAMFWFAAEAIGPSGKYSAGKSRTVVCGSRFDNDPEDKNKRTVDAHQEIIKLLVSDGWQPTGAKGSHWWSDKFRREVTSERQETEECEIKTTWASTKMFDSKVKFVACLVGRGMNPGELKVVAESQPFRKLGDLHPDESKTKPEVRDVHRSFVEQLLRDGWELKSTVGDKWYNRQFRRRVTN